MRSIRRLPGGARGPDAQPAAEEEPDAAGWLAIDAHLDRLYGGVEPVHWGTIVPWRLGGPDPLDAVSGYDNTGPPRHWHFVSYGLSELYEKESDDPDASGWGLELTFRVARRPRDEDAPPIWAMSFLQNLARYIARCGGRDGRPAGHGRSLLLA